MADFEGIYILTNPSFKTYVKIGKAVKQTIADRVRSLNASSAVPFAFNIYATYKTNNADRIEKMLHKLLDQFKYELRAREKTESGRERVREFFAMDAEQAFTYLQTVAEGFGDEQNVILVNKTKEQIDEEDIAVKVEVRAEKIKAANFSFVRKGISAGAQIEFWKDSKITARVIDEKYIEYQGQKYTLSGLAAKLLGKKTSEGVRGPGFFKYNNKPLLDYPDITD